MVDQTSGAGPFSITVDVALGVGESFQIDTRTAIPNGFDRAGKMRKFWGQREGFDYAVVMNDSSEIVRATSEGNISQRCPPDLPTPIEGNPPEGRPIGVAKSIQTLTITNTGILGGASINADLIEVGFGNNMRGEDLERNRGRSGFRISPESFLTAGLIQRK